MEIEKITDQFSIDGSLAKIEETFSSFEIMLKELTDNDINVTVAEQKPDKPTASEVDIKFFANEIHQFSRN